MVWEPVAPAGMVALMVLRLLPCIRIPRFCRPQAGTSRQVVGRCMREEGIEPSDELWPELTSAQSASGDGQVAG